MAVVAVQVVVEGEEEEEAAAEAGVVLAVVARAPRMSRPRDSMPKSPLRLLISSTRSISASTAACLDHRSSDVQTGPVLPVNSSSVFD